jgi:ferritin-like metal-binding protein YciE
VLQSELKELYVDELKDIYSAETQLVKALPKMAKAAVSAELRNGFQEHLAQTIAAYGTVRAMAEKLGDEKAVQLLTQTLQEEKDTDVKLSKLSDKMKVEADQVKAFAAKR